MLPWANDKPHPIHLGVSSHCISTAFLLHFYCISNGNNSYPISLAAIGVASHCISTAFLRHFYCISTVFLMHFYCISADNKSHPVSLTSIGVATHCATWSIGLCCDKMKVGLVKKEHIQEQNDGREIKKIEMMSHTNG